VLGMMHGDGDTTVGRSVWASAVVTMEIVLSQVTDKDKQMAVHACGSKAGPYCPTLKLN
jgi:hypothetical protein